MKFKPMTRQSTVLLACCFILLMQALCYGLPDGDVDGDSRVTGVDALILLRNVVGIDQTTPRMLSHGDVAPLGPDSRPHPDGIVSVMDALVILKKSIGLYSWEAQQSALVITSQPVSIASVGQPYNYQVTVSHSPGATIGYAIESGPAGLGIDNSSGMVSWLPPVERIGANQVTIKASDSTGEIVRQTYTIKVSDTTPPTAQLTIPPQVIAGAHFTVAATVTDNVAVSSVTLSMNGIQQGIAQNAPYQFHLVAPPSATPGTVLAIRVVVTDTSGNSSVRDAGITVISSVSITSQPTLTVVDSHPYRYGVTVSLFPGATAAFALESAPVGMTIGATSGQVDWVPRADQVGSHQVAIVVTDSNGQKARQAYSLRVTDGTAPTLQLTAPQQALPGSRVTVTATSADNLGVASVTFTVNGVQQAVVTSPPFTTVVAVPDLAVPGSLLAVGAVSVDAAGNSTPASATITITTTPDSEAPAVTLNAPARARAGGTISLSAAATDNVGIESVSLSVNGSIVQTFTAPPYVANYQVPASASGSSLAVSAIARDFAGNSKTATATTAVVADLPQTLPVITLTAPAQVAEGGTLSLAATVTDQSGLAAVQFAVNGLPIATGVVPPYRTDYLLPASVVAGELLRISVTATNLLNGSAVATAETLVVAALPKGEGLVYGSILDDGKGLPLAGAGVSVPASVAPLLAASPRQVTMDASGTYVINGSEGNIVARIEKNGYTFVERLGTIVANSAVALVDARLTQIDGRANLITAAGGGTASSSGGSASLIVPPGALAVDTDIRLTVLSGQGLRGELPLGWSAVGAVDLRPEGLQFGQAATLKLRNDAGLPPGSSIAAVVYDSAAHLWKGAGSAVVSADGSSIAYPVSMAGSLALVLADSVPAAPPAPQAGKPLLGVAAVPWPAAPVASGEVVPRSAPPGDNVKAVGRVTVTSDQPLPSGTRIRAAVAEQYSLTDASVVIPPPFSQDLVLYGATAGDGTRQLAASFPISPSRSYTVQELQQGTIRLEIQPPAAAESGAIIGADGGSFSDAGGDVIDIPAGALTANTVVSLGPLSAAQVPLAVPVDYELIQALRLAFPGPSLRSAAQLSMPRPPAVTAGPLLLAQVFSDAEGLLRLRLVARAELVADRIVTSAGTTGVPFPGITAAGTYLFLRPLTPVGYIHGLTVSGTPAAPRSGVLVTADTAPFADLTGSAGSYLLAGAAGSATTVTARDVAGAAAGSGSATVAAADGSATLDITLLANVPQVLSSSPAAGARAVPLDTPVSVLFSVPVDRASVTADSFRLSTGTQNVPAAVSAAADGRSATLVPAAPLASNTPYSINITAAVHDPAGHAMTPFQAAFTSVDTSRPAPLPAGQVTATLPDEDGQVLIAGSQGTANPGSGVTVTNLRSQETFTVLADDSGAFRLRIAAVVGDVLALTFRNAAGQEMNIRITQLVNADGSTAFGVGGGSITGTNGRMATIRPGALATAGIFSLRELAASVVMPVLPPSWHLMDSFDFAMRDAAFAGLKSMTLSQANDRFAPVTATQFPFAASASLVVPADFLVNGTLPFAAGAIDAAGNQANVSASTLVVATSPAPGSFGTISGDSFPAVALDVPVQATPNQAVTVTAVAPTARVDFTLPAPASVPAGTPYILTRLVQLAGQSYLALQDRLDLISRIDGTILQTAGRELPGATAAGTYAVIGADMPLVFVSGKVSGPPALVSLDGTPVAYVTTTPNAYFTLPVPAGQSFAITFRDGTTGDLRGSATGTAPASGILDLGDPLGGTASTLRVAARPDSTTPVDIATPLEFTFSEAVDEQTLAAAIRVTDPTGSRVAGSFNRSADGLRATFTPQRRWRFASSYRYTVAPTVTALSGNRPAAELGGQFTTFAPQLLSTVPGDSVRDLALSGPLAVAAGVAGLTTYDLTAADTPLKSGSLSLQGGASGIALMTGATLTDRNGAPVPAKLALVAAGSTTTAGSLQVVDLTAPAAPVAIGSTRLTTPTGSPAVAGVPNLPGTPAAVAVTADQRAVVAVRGIGVESVGIGNSIPADPANPGRALGPLYPATGTDSASQTALLGSNMLVAGVSGLTILDATTLAKKANIATTGEASGVAAVSGFRMDMNGDGIIDAATEVFDLALVANGLDGTLQFYNLADPANPTLVSAVHLPKPAAAVTIDSERNLAYVGCGSYGVAAVDLSGPASIQPMDDNHDGIDDRILAQIKTAGSAGRMALNPGAGLVHVADGDAGITTLQLMPASVAISDVLRDPVTAASGEEQSIVASRTAYTTDDAIQVKLNSLIPPRTKLYLTIQELPNAAGPQLLAFADGSTTALLTSGSTTQTLLINKSVPSTGSSVQVRVQDSAGRVVTSFDATILVPNTLGTTVEQLSVIPESMTLSPGTSGGKVTVRGKLSDGRWMNLTSSASGTVYQVDNSAVASIDIEGAVSALAGGTAQISATNSQKTAYGTVKVQLPPVLVGIAVSQQYMTLIEPVTTWQIPVIGIYSDGTTKDISADPATTYSVADTLVATVSPSGFVTAGNDGTTAITITNGTYTAGVSISVEHRGPATVTGIILDPMPGPYYADEPIIAKATVAGTGNLLGLPVTFTVSGFTGGPVTLTQRVGLLGVVQVSLEKIVATGNGTLTVITTDPSTGQQMSSVQQFVVIQSKNGDSEPNNDITHASILKKSQPIIASVGGSDSRDVYTFDVKMPGKIIINVDMYGNADFNNVNVIITTQNGTELYRGALNNIKNNIQLSLVTGTYYVSIENTSVTKLYKLRYYYSQDSVSITTVSPLVGKVGDNVTINGSGFGSDVNNCSLYIGGALSKIISISDNQITAVISPMAIDGDIELIINNSMARFANYIVNRPTSREYKRIEHGESAIRYNYIENNFIAIDSLIIKAAIGVDSNIITNIIESNGGKVITYLPTINAYTCLFSSSRNVVNIYAIMKVLKTYPEIIDVVTNKVIKEDWYPDYTNSKEYDSSNENPYEVVGLYPTYKLIRMNKAKLASRFNSKIAVLDSGFDPVDASQFTNNGTSLVDRYSFDTLGKVIKLTSSQKDVVSMAHGTNIISLLAEANNSRNINGVINGYFDVMQNQHSVDSYNMSQTTSSSIKCLLLPSVEYSTADHEKAMLEHIMDRRDIKVVNMSYGLSYDVKNDSFNQLRDDYKYYFKRRQDILFITSAGNTNTDASLHLPSALTDDSDLQNVMAVSAATAAINNSIDEKTSYSNYDSKFNFAAPGKYVLHMSNSKKAPLTNCVIPNYTTYKETFGTSFAAPTVAAVASMMFSIGQPGTSPDSRQELSASDVKQILIETADDISYKWKFASIAVRLNAFQAILKLLPAKTVQSAYVLDIDNRIIELPLTYDVANAVYAIDVNKPSATHVLQSEAPVNSAVINDYDQLIYYVSVKSNQTYISTYSMSENKVTDEILVPGTKTTKHSIRLSKNNRLLYIATDNGIKVLDTIFYSIIKNKHELPGLDPVYKKQLLENTLLTSLEKSLEIITNLAGEYGGIERINLSSNNSVLYIICRGKSGLQTTVLPINIRYDSNDTANYLEAPQVLRNNIPLTSTGKLLNGAYDVLKDVAVDPADKYLYLVHGASLFVPINPSLENFFSILGSEVWCGLCDTNKLIEEYRNLLSQGRVLAQSPGNVSVFSGALYNSQSTSGLDSFNFLDGFKSILIDSQTNPARKSVVDTMEPVYARAPHGMAIRPDGKRALVPFFLTGNFGVMDLERQNALRPSSQRPDGFNGFIAYTPKIKMDNFLWPVEERNPVTNNIDGLSLMYPTSIKYAQSGSFAVAVHAGTSDGRQGQSGALTIISDKKLTDVLDQVLPLSSTTSDTSNTFAVDPLPKSIMTHTYSYSTGAQDKKLTKPMSVDISTLLDIDLKNTVSKIGYEGVINAKSKMLYAQSYKIIVYDNTDVVAVRKIIVTSPNMSISQDGIITIPINSLFKDTEFKLLYGHVLTMEIVVTSPIDTVSAEISFIATN